MKKSIFIIFLAIIVIVTLVGCEADKVEKITIVSFQETGGQLGAKEMLLTLEVNIPNSASQAEVDSARQAYLIEWQQSHPEYKISDEGYLKAVWYRNEYVVRHFSYHITSVK